jgi:hypothetical protein
MGMFMHFKTQQEVRSNPFVVQLILIHVTQIRVHLSLQENDQMLNNGALGDERKLYYRELIARFSHHVSHLLVGSAGLSL